MPVPVSNAPTLRSSNAPVLPDDPTQLAPTEWLVNPPDRYDRWITDETDTGRSYRVRREDQIEAVWQREFTPKRVRAVLDSAANGMPREQAALFDIILESDAVLAGIVETRYNAILNRPWEIVPASEVVSGADIDEKAAQDAADYCREQISGLPFFGDITAHLLSGIGYSLAGAENVWEPDGKGHAIHSIVPVEHRSLQGDPLLPWKQRVRSSEAAYPGYLVDAMPNKWIFHSPRRIGGNFFRGGLLRISAMLWCVRAFGFRWWTNALEQFGEPKRWAELPAGFFANAQLKASVEQALKNFGVAAYGIFPEGTKITLQEAMKGAEKWPHNVLCECIDKWQAILWLGQDATTFGTPGKLGAETERGEVRDDIRNKDIKTEGETIRRDLLTPMVLLAAKFGGRTDIPIPYFRRIVEKPKDYKVEMTRLDGAVNRLGLKVKNSYAYECLDIPMPDPISGIDPEGFVEGAPQAAIPGDEESGLPSAGDAPQPGKPPLKKAATSAVPPVPSPQRPASPVSVLNSWISHAVDACRRHVATIVEHCADAIGATANGPEAIHLLSRCIQLLPQSNFAAAIGDYVHACALSGCYATQRRMDAKRSSRKIAKRIIADAMAFEGFVRPFSEAIQALSERVHLSPDDFLKLERAARNRAGRIAGEFNLQIVKDVYTTIGDTLGQGGAVRDFRQAIKQLPERDGWTGANPYHANLVFRQNAVMSFGAGNHAAMVDAGVKAWTWRTYDQPCPICEPMDGSVLSIDDTSIYPGGAHFACECYADPVFDDEMPDELETADDLRNEHYDKSQKYTGALKYDPAEFGKLRPFSLDTVPAELKTAFRNYAHDHGWTVNG